MSRVFFFFSFFSTFKNVKLFLNCGPHEKRLDLACGLHLANRCSTHVTGLEVCTLHFPEFLDAWLSFGFCREALLKDWQEEGRRVSLPSASLQHQRTTVVLATPSTWHLMSPEMYTPATWSPRRHEDHP